MGTQRQTAADDRFVARDGLNQALELMNEFNYILGTDKLSDTLEGNGG